MSDTQSDATKATGAEADSASARSVLRTSEWINDEWISGDGQFRVGELPLWNRLESAPQGKQHRWRWLPGFSWCVVLGLAVIALLRIVWHDGAWPLILLNAFTLYLYLPAYFVLAFAIATRRFALAAASTAIVACHLAWVAPDWRPAQAAAGGADRGQCDGHSVRIYFANVHASNQDLEGVLNAARRFDPDVIVLVEMQRWWWHKLIDSRPLPDYPYGTDLDQRNAGDVGVFSRLPVRRFEQIAVAGRTVLALDLAVDGETLRLFALHSPRPTPDSRDSYFEFWKLIERVVTKEQGPVAVIGDFNATQFSRVYRQLQEGGLRSAYEDRGEGASTTWPTFGPFPLIRIDQVFLSPEVKCISIEVGDIPGSDHRSLFVDLLVGSAQLGRDDR
ncbi:MAG: endonuclease/exonuclease/phosphatase family protein [Pirellulales bacterium]